MSDSKQPMTPRQPVVGLQIKLPCASPEDFRLRHGQEVAAGVLFVRTRMNKPAGTLVRFDIRLADGATFLRGLASVKSSASPADAPERPGMHLQLRAVDLPSQEALKGLGIESSIPTFRPPQTLPPARLNPSREAPAAPAPESPSREAAPASEETAESHAPATPAARPDSLPHGGPVIGIDLGSAKSAAAWVRGSTPTILASRDGQTSIPSVVSIDESGQLLTGQPAKNQWLINPRNTISGAKRLVGRAFHSEIIPQLQSRLPYQIVEGSKGEAAVSVGVRTLSLQEITAQILKGVRAIAEDYLGQNVTRAVITVPAYYSDVQRQAVRDAGTLAGLTVEQIVSEPTAAALAFGRGRTLHQRILVYDLGGGTFDVSVLELRGGNIYEVISTGGDAFLGGVDFDLRILSLLIERFEGRYGQPLKDDPALIQRFLDAAEQTKKALSESAAHHARVPFVPLTADRLVEFDTVLTRAELEQATGDLVDRTLDVTAEVLAARQLKPTDVEEVLLVGGQSRMPLVRERLRAFFGKDPDRAVNPEELVAMGAAILAHGIETEAPNGTVLVDVLPMSIGVGLPGGRFKPVIRRNTSLPHTHTYTATAGETELLIFQGESDRALENQYLGSVRLVQPPNSPPDGRMDVTFRLSREAVLSIAPFESEGGGIEILVQSARETMEQLREKLAEPKGTASRRGGVFGRIRSLLSRRTG